MRQLLVITILCSCMFVANIPCRGQQQTTGSSPLPDTLANTGEVRTWAYLGINGGANISDVYFSDTFRPVAMRTSTIYGRHFGFVGKLFLAPHAGIQMQVNYVEKGYEQIFLHTVGFYSAKMNYLEVPLMANAYFGKRRNEIFVNAGPYFEIFLSQKETKIGEETEDEEFYPFNPGTDRTMGYGVRASAGINRRFVFGLVQLEGGMALTISDMLVTNRLTSQVPDGSKHFMGFVTLSYMLPIGKKPMP